MENLKGTCYLRTRQRKIVTTDSTEIQKIIRNYYEHLHANKQDSLEEVYNILVIYNLQRLNQEETENLNRSLMSKEIKSNKKPSNKEKPRTRWLHW